MADSIDRGIDRLRCTIEVLKDKQISSTGTFKAENERAESKEP